VARQPWHYVSPVDSGPHRIRARRKDLRRYDLESADDADGRR
jgi:hypothetical protein